MIVTSHDAFGYFGDAFGLVFEGVEGVTTASSASAARVADLIDRIRREGVRALFVETLVNPSLLEQISRETGVAIGGALYPDALTGPNGPAPSYIRMMRHNAETIAAALADG